MFRKLATLSSFALVALAAIISFDVLADTKKSIDDFYNLTLEELGQIEISIATGNATTLDRAPATATLISSAEINAMGARNLDEILETVPGLHVSLSSLSRLDSIYSIRGIHTGFNPQVLLMLNGVPVQYSLQGARPTLFRLPAASIERVEIIRGPGSAVYGADAFSGVVNVITKDASTISKAEIGARVGSFGSRELWAQTATRVGEFGLSFGLSYQKTEGDDKRVINADLQTTLDQSPLATNASLAPGVLSTGYEILDMHLSLSGEQTQANVWGWISQDAGVGAGAAQAIDTVGNDDSKLIMIDATHKFLSNDDWSNQIHASHLHYDIDTVFRILPPGTTVPIGSDGNLDFAMPVGVVQFPDGLFGNPGAHMEDSRFEYVSLYSGWTSHRLRLAVGARRQSLEPRETKNFGPGVIDGSVPVIDGTLTKVTGTSFIYLDDTTRRLRYISLQDEWQIIPDLDLTTGLRYDDYSDFGNTTNPRIALVWGASEKVTAKALYGSAFRAPSFAELGFKNNPVSLGNKNLKPEKIDTLEISVNFRATDTLQFTTTAFYYEAKDMIEFIFDFAGTTKTAQNAFDQKGDGLEFELSWKPNSQFFINGSYAYQDAENKFTDTAIADAPGQQFKINSNWEFITGWHLNGQANWVADRERMQGDTRPEVDDYLLLNMTLRAERVLDDLDVFLSIRNITDEDAYEPSSGTIRDDYPLESRSVWLGASYMFD